MKRARRVALAAEAERRIQAAIARAGGDVLAMRRRRGWTQAELADRAGVSRTVIGRLERAELPIDVETLERAGLALGAPLRIEFGRDPRLEIADAGHLAMQELVLRLGRGCGYEARFELATKPGEPWRSVDVVLAGEARRQVICVECWNVIGDIGAAVRSSERKAAEVDALAAGLWGEGVRTGLVWVVKATARNRALVARYAEVFASRFTGSSERWVEALTAGREPPVEPGLVWCDLAATRLWAWRRRAR